MTHGAAHLEMGYARNRLIFREIRKTINRRCAVRCYTCSCQTSFYAPAGHIRHCRCAQKCDTCSRRHEGITIFSISYTDHPFPGVPEEPLAASSLNAFVRIIPLQKVRDGAKKAGSCVRLVSGWHEGNRGCPWPREREGPTLWWEGFSFPVSSRQYDSIK